jgi:hypothetical protein
MTERSEHARSLAAKLSEIVSAARARWETVSQPWETNVNGKD